MCTCAVGAPRVKKMVATAKTGGTKRHLTSEFVSEPESKKHLQVDQVAEIFCHLY